MKEYFKKVEYAEDKTYPNRVKAKRFLPRSDGVPYWKPPGLRSNGGPWGQLYTAQGPVFLDFGDWVTVDVHEKMRVMSDDAFNKIYACL